MASTERTMTEQEWARGRTTRGPQEVAENLRKAVWDGSLTALHNEAADTIEQQQERIKELEAEIKVLREFADSENDKLRDAYRRIDQARDEVGPFFRPGAQTYERTQAIHLAQKVIAALDGKDATLD